MRLFHKHKWTIVKTVQMITKYTGGIEGDEFTRAWYQCQDDHNCGKVVTKDWKGTLSDDEVKKMFPRP